MFQDTKYRRSATRGNVVPKACALLLAAALLPACARSVGSEPAKTSAAAPVTTSAVTRALPDFSQLVNTYGRAVVNVVSTQEMTPVSAQQGQGQISPNDPFFEFFRRFGIPVPGVPNGPQSRAPLRGEGSGFIINADGHILTNAHVVEHASEVTVKLTDRREFPAKVIGIDPRTDVAVLKIDAQNLPTVKLGDSSKLKPGEWVVAIGSPFGFENSVTAGVVSATSRAVGSQNSLVPFIQTDVAVNPGNSGGPLFNMNGEVVGINSMIYTGTGGYQGVSFAIPIGVALDVEQQLVKNGHVTRGRIGVAIQEVNAQLAQSFGLDRPRGALVSSVEKGGPAEKAGIKPGDVIVGVDGRKVEVSSEVPGMIAHIAPGTTANLDIIRNGKPENIAVRVAELKDNGTQVASNQNGSGSNEDEPRLGLSVRPLTPDERQEADTSGGLVIEQATGPAQAAGLQAGDIILRVGDQPVKSADDLRKAVHKGANSVALLIQRQDAQIYVPIRVG
jgi:serine protease Do